MLEHTLHYLLESDWLSTYSHTLHKLVNNSCSADHRELSEDVGDYPSGHTIQQTYTLFNAWRLSSGFGSMCIYTKLTELRRVLLHHT